MQAGRGVRRTGKAIALFAFIQLFGMLLLPSIASAVPPAHPFLEVFGSAAEPELSGPAGMTVDPATGDLYVINFEEIAEEEFGLGSLHRYKPDGTPANFSALSGNVIDGHAGEEDEVPGIEEILSFSGGGFLRAAETQVAVAPPGAPGGTAGNIYVTDAVNEVIDIFASSGKFLGQKKVESHPCGVAVDAAGNLYVGAQSGVEEGVHKYTPTGSTTFTESPNSPYAASGSCHLVADDGFVYSESPFFDIAKIDSEGVEEGVTKFNLGSAAGSSSIDPVSGHLFIANIFAEPPQIEEFDVSGASAARLTSSTSVSGFPSGFAVDAVSNLFVTQFENKKIEVFAPLPEFELKIQKAGAGTGTVTSAPAGINCGATCTASFTEGEPVELTATPEGLSSFTGWTTIAGNAGTCAGTTSPCLTTIEAAVELKATFNLPAPTVTGINPKTGPTTGGTEVTITGTNLEGATEVKFGAIPALEIKSGGTSTQIVVKSPPGTGVVDVTVTTPSGTSATSAANKFTYVAPPTITGLSPKEGPTAGGTLVTITGTNLTGATKVEFGSSVVNCADTVATCKVESATQIKTTSPAHAAGTVDVVVTTSGGGPSANTAADDYTYVGPQALTVTKAGTGSGSVTCDGGPCAATYAFEAKVTLAAAAAAGSKFTGWSGAGCSGTGACTVTIKAATAVTATFTADPPTPTCATNPALCPPPPPPPVTKGTPKVGPTAPYSGGKASLTISCVGGPCKGALELSAKIKQGKKTKNVVIGSASYEVAAGQSLTIKVKITNGQAKKQLNQGKALTAKLGGDGLSGSVKIKPPAKKKKK